MPIERALDLRAAREVVLKKVVCAHSKPRGYAAPVTGSLRARLWVSPNGSCAHPSCRCGHFLQRCSC